jgi:uncharacterized protein (TIGR02996 family)
MDETAFLAAIAARPAESGPRLVYADWLEERGDPRGPLLRDVCRLTEADLDAVPNPDCHTLESRVLEQLVDLFERGRGVFAQWLELVAQTGDWPVPLIEEGDLLGSYCACQAARDT